MIRIVLRDKSLILAVPALSPLMLAVENSLLSDLVISRRVEQMDCQNLPRAGTKWSDEASEFIIVKSSVVESSGLFLLL